MSLKHTGRCKGVSRNHAYTGKSIHQISDPPSTWFKDIVILNDILKILIVNETPPPLCSRKRATPTIKSRANNPDLLLELLEQLFALQSRALQFRQTFGIQHSALRCRVLWRPDLVVLHYYLRGYHPAGCIG